MIMAASYIVKGDSFVPDKPRVWSEKPLANTGFSGYYDLAPDGKRIAAFMRAGRASGEDKQAQSHVIFLLNFADELRRRVPEGK